ncbi:MAG: hypothetical protein Q8N53_05620 [Longimicrobiales bacterium]|nr:hypothetical protein [Longimicrobiales bacterium]
MFHRVPPARSAFFLLLLSTAACAPSLGQFATHRRSDAVSAQFLVRSAHWEDLTIYLDREGSLFRLGVVGGNDSRTLRIPDEYLRANCWGRLVAMSPAREPHAVSEIFGLAKGDYGVWEIGTIGRSTPVRFEDPPAP